MPSLVEVEIDRSWDGSDHETNELASLRLCFTKIASSSDLLPPEKYKYKDLFFKLQGKLRQFADARFGSNIVQVRCERVTRGSLVIWLVLTTVTGTTYTFFKDYETLRKNLFLFVDDIKAAAPKLHRLVDEMYASVTRPRTHEADQEHRGRISH